LKQLTLSGKLVNVPTTPYQVDWDGKQGSKFSKDVLDFLRPYWKNDKGVLAEWPVAGSRMRYDFVNLSRKIIIESDGVQHDRPNTFHHGKVYTETNYLAQIKRDLDKDTIAEKNGFILVRIKPSDLPLTKEWFKEKYNIDL